MSHPINPYVAGRQVGGERGFFGRQDVLDWVNRELRNPATNALVLFGQRRIGKTSLLRQLQYTLPSSAFLPVYFDLHNKASYPLGQVLASLAKEAASCASLEPPRPDAFDDQGQFFHSTFLPYLYQVLGDGRRPVFLLDEFDVLDHAIATMLPEMAATKTFFAFLQDVMAVEFRPTFVFAVGRQVEDLSLDYKATFKTSLVKQIWVLDGESAEALVRQAEANGTLHFTKHAVARILSLTGCHPYLTQLLCQRLWERAYRGNPTAPPSIDTLDVNSAIPDTLETGESALIWIWDGLSVPEKIYAAALAEIANEGDIIPKGDVIQVLTGHAARLRAWGPEQAPPELVKRKVLDVVGDREYRFAVELFRRWVRENKPRHEVKDEIDSIEPQAKRLFSLGQGAFDKGQWEESVGLFQSALEKNRCHFRARLYLGGALLELGQTEEAVVELEQAYKMDRGEAHYALARALVARAQELKEKEDDEDEALAACKRALDISPGEWQAQEIRTAIWIRRGDAAMERGALDTALAAYQQAGAEGWEDAVDFVQLALEENPDLFRTRLHLGEVLLELDRIDEAVTELELAYELDQDEARLSLARALVVQAQELEEDEDEDGALEACERALQLSPGEQEAQEMRTAIWIRRRDIALERNELNTALDAHQQAGVEPGEESFLFLQRVLMRNHRHFRARLHLGQLLLELDKTDEAVTEMERAYKLNPDEVQVPLVHALIAWARAQEEDGEEEGALAACERALEISPDEKEAEEIRTAIWIRRGDAALEQDALDIALAAYRHAEDELKIKKVKKIRRRRDQETLVKEATAYEQAKQWAEAIEIYQRLLGEADDEEIQGEWNVALQCLEDQRKAELSRAKPGGWSPGYPLDKRYEIVKHLATTAHSEVYRAEELQPPHHTVVVKRLKPDKLQDDNAYGRFEREILVLRRIRHQSVLFLLDSKTLGRDRYFVTEFADRGTLKEYLAVRPAHKLRPIEALEIALSVCQGLEAAHRQGIIHRDVKPGNVFLFSQPDRSTVAKLADFSIARVPGELGDKTLTQMGSFIGTRHYASPEQINADIADPRSDLYSWAIVFFEMLTGESPTDSLKDPLTFAPTLDEFPTPFFVERGVPLKLAEVLQKSLCKDRKLRYQSAAEVREALETIKAQLMTDIERHLSEGEAHIRSFEWQSANAEFEQGLALCGWYDEPDELRGHVGELARLLRNGYLYAQGMMHLSKQKWQAAVAALEPLRTLDPNYLGMDIAAQLRRAQSERQREQKYHLLLQHRKREDWPEILRLAPDITTSYGGSLEGESVGDIRKLALYARGKSLLEEGGLESAYHQFYRLYQEDPSYEDVAELCARVAFGNAMRGDIPFSWEHQVEWLEKALEIAPNHRDGRTQQGLDRVRHRWAEELLGQRK